MVIYSNPRGYVICKNDCTLLFCGSQFFVGCKNAYILTCLPWINLKVKMNCFSAYLLAVTVTLSIIYIYSDFIWPLLTPYVEFIPNPKMVFIFPISCILVLIFPFFMIYFPKSAGKGSFPKSQIKSLIYTERL